jgi:hypothetical protein
VIERLKKPVFFIGMPRSGTTIMFEAFSRHPALAWPSNYAQDHPEQQAYELLRAILDTRYWQFVGRKPQGRKHRLGNRFMPHPAEAYPFWNLVCRRDFGRGYLRDIVVDQETIERVRNVAAKIVKYQARQRFSAKFTGPPRIRYLRQIFPDAQFVHIVRDGRAVVRSLLKVGFWKNKGGFDAPFWNGDFPEQMVREWELADRDPGVLAALQWRHVVTRCREEGAELEADQYTEVSYESFTRDPIACIDEILTFADLDSSASIADYLSNTPKITDMNKKFADEFSPDYVALLTEKLQPALSQFDYEIA